MLCLLDRRIKSSPSVVKNLLLNLFIAEFLKKKDLFYFNQDNIFIMVECIFLPWNINEIESHI